MSIENVHISFGKNKMRFFLFLFGKINTKVKGIELSTYIGISNTIFHQHSNFTHVFEKYAVHRLIPQKSKTKYFIIIYLFVGM